MAVAIWVPAGPALALSDTQQLVVEAWRLVNQSYVDPDRFEAIRWRQLRQKALEQPIETSAAAYDAIASMLAPLGDPYTRLLRPVDYQVLRSSTEGSLSGIGLQLGLSPDGERILAITPIEGSPAALAGIVTGSQILEVEGQSAAALGLEATAGRLRGAAGTKVELLLLTPEGSQQALVLERRELDLQPVRSRELEWQGHRLGYLRINQFSEPVPGQVKEALTRWSAAGIEGLILDLRNDSGGLVESGLAVADGLLDGEPVVETMDRQGLREQIRTSPGLWFAGPMVTLVNGGTASASEILAGALQDDGRSLLLGSRTFGKGLIQTLIGLGDGSGLAVTVARYVTPSGRDIQNLGIAPDRLLAEPEPLNPGGTDDTWLEEAQQQLVDLLDPRP
ncbi:MULTISPECIES: carboxyl-terminal processing protease CtpZ [Synechococcaceae]|uniref:carboxyl-terminal processing protease CtpZ n=1 Tax=Synechococcaceae TaxID=1890426 RepID=UPI0008FF2648|nr:MULTISPECIES: carboxyl-terminal processing protease CtpZ [Synechococcaceae]APD49480.1 peptidase S41 [Synechococcus sp. SynAce01]MCT4365931.1 S41 family peptidase [Candidatus Regnicoccus frigidus MAG-AL1]MCT4366206.1 S41 family peptidase [Candidatus Regnicoccus frigidus MAG-AL2]